MATGGGEDEDDRRRKRMTTTITTNACSSSPAPWRMPPPLDSSETMNMIIDKYYVSSSISSMPHFEANDQLQFNRFTRFRHL